MPDAWKEKEGRKEGRKDPSEIFQFGVKCIFACSKDRRWRCCCCWYLISPNPYIFISSYLHTDWIESSFHIFESRLREPYFMSVFKRACFNSSQSRSRRMYEWIWNRKMSDVIAAIV